MSNWPVKTLGEVCEVVNGATPDTKVDEYWGGEHAWITPAEMGGLDTPYLSSSRRTLTTDGLESCSATLVPPQTVILSSRAPIGHLVINEIPMATNQGCKSLKPKTGLDHKFLYFFLKANVELLESLGTGTTFKELSGTQLKTVEIPVPPLEEQKRIVELLDAATAHISELTSCYEQARTHANNLFTSALREALESNPDWPVKTLGEVCDFVSGSVMPKPGVKYQVFSVPSFDSGNPELLNGSEIKSAKRPVQRGDVLLCKINPRINRVWRVDRDSEHQQIASTEWITLRCKESVLDVFLQYVMQSPRARTAMIESVTGATGSHTRAKFEIVQGLEFTVPPLREQRRIVASLDLVRAKTTEMVAAYDAKLTAAKNLRQSVLEAAFAGDL